MNVQEMHTAFRTIGQQMGIQLVRGILPESIDILINDVINEKIQQELLLGVRTVIQEQTDTQPSTTSPINLFRNLLRTARFSIESSINGSPVIASGTVTDDSSESGIVSNNTNKLSYYSPINGFHIINIPTIDSGVITTKPEYNISPMMYLGFSIEYPNTNRGNSVACRLIGADVLETTLRDYCNGASKDSPIVCLNSVPNISNGSEQSDIKSNEKIELYINSKQSLISKFNIKYIKVPAKVKYDIDINKCINCDLPEYTHYEIVERAVQKYRASILIPSNTNNVRQTS